MKVPSSRKQAGIHLEHDVIPSAVFRGIFSRTRTAQFQKYARDLLIELCRIDTTPKQDPEQMRRAEDRCFRILERELRALPFANAHLERRSINPDIQKHPNYSLLHFTKTALRPQGLSPETTYAGRSNLIYLLKENEHRPAGKSVALNAHIDVVAPFFPPKRRGHNTVFSRGACDDKGPVVSIIAALKVLSEVMSENGVGWNRNVLSTFVVEEETGGNGSLSLAIDRELKRAYESVVVCECTGLKIHPANRGAVWYRAELTPPGDVSPLEMFAFVNEEMEKEGRAIRAESRHELFPQRPVQTCHGMIGEFGEHPSRICGEVSFDIAFGGRPGAKAKSLLNDCLEAGLAEYIGLYGDKTKVKDAVTGKPLVARHYHLEADGRRIRVHVHGATGHMGAIRERDGAITKMAHLVRALVFSKARLEGAVGTRLTLELAHPKAKSSSAGLVFEGGQGFVPTHGLAEVMQRLRLAAERGAETYLRRIGRDEKGRKVITVAYEKLHNDAFAGDPHSTSVQNAVSAARSCGISKPGPILGWTVSCDARLFANEYPDLEVLTFGPGQLSYAHSDEEQIDLDEIRGASEFLALFLLKQTATLIES
jgi:acetylornithine deacetylase/succinyl-diaminopimelate desuccinylase-like protein